MVGPVVAEPEPRRLGARGPRDDLMSEADAKERPAVVDDRPGKGDRALQARRISWPGRQDQAVHLAHQRDRGRDRVRQDPDAGAAPAHRADDVRLEPEVDDPDQRATVVVTADVHDRGRRHLADEVLVLPARDGAGAVDRRVTVDEPRLRHDPAEAPVRTQVAGECAGVHAGDGRDPGPPQERRDLADVVEHGGRGVGDGERPEPRPDRLIVLDQPAVVPDQRVRHDHDLTGVRRVGADLLVAGLRRVDDEVAAGGIGRPEGDPRKDGPVLQREERRPKVADARVDDRAGPGLRGPRGGGRRSRRDHRLLT